MVRQAQGYDGACQAAGIYQRSLDSSKGLQACGGILLLVRLADKTSCQKARVTEGHSAVSKHTGSVKRLIIVCMVLAT